MTFTVSEQQNKITPLQEQIDILYKQIKKPATPQKKAHEMIQSFDDILDNGNFDDIKLLIDALIDRIEIDGEDVTIFWAFI